MRVNKAVNNNNKRFSHSRFHQTNSIFRYARWYDTLFMLLGSILAVVAGCCLPVILFLIGQAITSFTSYTIVQKFVNSSGEYFCNDSIDISLMEYATSTDSDQLLRDRITVYISSIFGVAAILFVSSSVSNFLWTLSAANQANCMRIAFLEASLRQDIAWYDINSPLQLLSVLTNDIQKVEDGIGSKAVNFIKEFTTVIAGIIISFILNWKLALAIGSFVPFLLIIIFIVAKISSIATIKEQTALGHAGEVAETAFLAIRTVKAFGGEQKEQERYATFLTSAKSASYRKQAMSALIYGFFSFVVFALYGFGLWYGAHILIDCEVTSGVIFTILFEIASGLLNLNEALPLLGNIGTAVGAKTGVYSVIDQEFIHRNNNNHQVTLDKVDGHIRFFNVTFSYPSRPDVPILQGFDLTIKEGQTIALVGPSGCGKSTVLHLLQQLYTQDNGTIMVDDVDIKELNLSWLRNQIGIVSQEPVIFNVSIGENIGYGKEGASEEDIKRAAIAANAYDFISMLPNGFNTIVGDAGSQLSGGQKQRIAIARALLHDPKILLLDEATSALDNESEKIVNDSLRIARHGCTTIIVAHRLSTIQSADVIVVIDKGSVVEVGTHSELMNQSGLYSELLHNQTIDSEVNNEQADFNKAYRESVRLRKSKRRKQAFIFSSIIEEPSDPFEPSPGRRKHSLLASLTRRVSEGFLSVTEMHATTVNSNLFQTQLSSFDEEEEDDVFSTDELQSSQSLPLHLKLHPSSFKTLFKLVKPGLWLLLIGAAGFILMGLLLSVIYILLSGVAQAFAESNRETLLSKVQDYLVIYLAMGLLAFILHFVAVFCLGVASDQLTMRIRHQSFAAILKQDLSFFDMPENSASILNQRLVMDASEINQASGLPMGITIRGIINVIIGYVIALQATWVLGLVSLISIVVFLIGGFIQLKLTKQYSKIKNLKEEGNKTAIEAIENVYTVASLGIYETFVRKYEILLNKPCWYTVVTAVVQSALYASMQAITLAITAGLIGLGAFVITSSQTAVYYADFESIIRASGAMLYTSLIFKEMFRYLPDAEGARVSANNFVKLLNKEPQIKNDCSKEIFNSCNDVKIHNVEFAYPTRPLIPVLNHLTLSIPSGKTIALVGTSGSGKSTIISLIERFYDPTRGTILLDNEDISELNIIWLRRQISLVSQEPVLFNMSIADNIRYGALFRSIGDEEVIEAAKVANIHEFITTLPNGYETNVGVKGTQLSGGQKQRIAIARALVRDPKILLLDEATSALDTESEKLVQDALESARQGRTTIVIAHRLTTISNSDNIVVLHKGRVKEQGTHTELMKRKGAYFFMNNVTVND